MRHQEVHKFCDATLKRVLKGLKSYNNDVKHGYVTPSLSNKDVEYLQLFKEEIEERLKHRDQMRRWEIYSRRLYITNHKCDIDKLISIRSQIRCGKGKYTSGELRYSLMRNIEATYGNIDYVETKVRTHTCPSIDEGKMDSITHVTNLLHFNSWCFTASKDRQLSTASGGKSTKSLIGEISPKHDKKLQKADFVWGIPKLA
ncbi:hypothetical protein Tco_1292324 [Tanacetum coccineum]